MKKLLLGLSLFIVSTIGFCQEGFDENLILDDSFAGSRAQYIKSADIDGDGFKDAILVSGVEVEYMITWFKNIDGNGTFRNRTIIGTNTEGYSNPEIKDIDLDGDLDIFIASYSKIVWFENDGQGNFTQNVISAEIGIRSIEAKDIDNDGDIDLIIGGRAIYWFENNGLGNFGAKQIISEEPDILISDIELVDIDSDGDIDLLTLQRDVILYENIDGLGAFGSAQIIQEEVAVTSLPSLKSGDIDGDGDIDIVVAAFTKLIWLSNDGQNNFTQVSIDDISTNVVFLSDIDNDGDLDIVSNENNTMLNRYLNDGTGTFTKYQLTSSVYFVNDIFISDIDNDGFKDVLSASGLDNKFAWYKNLDNNVFSYQQIVNSSVFSLITKTLTADVDGDGDLDLVAFSGRTIAWYENLDGQGNFSYQQHVIVNRVRNLYFDMSDIDNDGDIDIVYVVTNGLIYWVENNGVGVFNDEHQVSIHTSYGINLVSMQLADLDGDEDLDLLFSEDQNNKVYFYENVDGLGDFSNLYLIDNNISNPNVSAKDIDGDGDLDIFGFNYTFGVFWYENLNNQDFSTKNTISTVGRTIKAISYDIDGDGDLDIVTKTYNPESIDWYENIDGQNFSSVQTISPNNSSVKDLLDVDLDGDGKIDFIAVSDSILWFRNSDGQGDFSQSQIISNFDGDIKSVNVSDINGDGDVDILAASINMDKLAWYENLGLINKIQGNIHLDIDNNGCDINDIVTPNVLIITDNATEIMATFTNNSGYYQLFPGLGSYTTTITSELPNYFDFSPISYNHNFTDLGNTETANFCIQPNQIVNDVNISIIPLSDARPGFESSYQIVYKNRGTTQLSGNIILEYDNTKLNFIASSETSTSQTANSITFNYSDLNPFETRTINLEFNVLAPPTVNIDDVLDFTATINPIAGDETPDDNVYEFNQTVIGSYDPNDIAVAEGEQILIEDADKYLHYIIRFQNTGSAHAIKVRVNNILDDKLDWTTLQLESYSHENTVEIKNGSEIDFIFNAIYLPDSTSDEPNSHGYIAYKIKPKNTAAVGDVFVNKADIYFDFNTAIETNTVTTEIVNTLAVADNNLLNFTIYPVPTTDILKINSKSDIQKIEIYNKLGQLVLEEGNRNEINTSNLNQGLYFVKITDAYNNTGVKKVFKK